MKNIVTVLTVVEELKNIGFDISNNIILDGIKNVKKNTGLRGRWDIISRNPLIICDTAHNQAGIRETMKQLNAINKKKLHIVLGMVNDKDIKHILETLPLNAEYYYCKADVPRGLNVDILEQQATAIGLKGKAYKSVTDAVENAKQKAEKEDVIYIGGGTFVVADFYKEIDNLLY
jgi:dihydrofolate synthase/folylpolyglutamate synthase